MHITNTKYINFLIKFCSISYTKYLIHFSRAQINKSNLDLNMFLIP